MIFERRLSSRQSSWTPPIHAPPMTTTTTDQPPPAHSSASNQTPSRLKRMSGATVRRLSRPLSMVSRRSDMSARDGAPDKQHRRAPPAAASPRASSARRTSPPARPRSGRRSWRLPTAAGAAGQRSSATGEGAKEQEQARPGLRALPVFGISQRAYLASLLSLVSRGQDAAAGAAGTTPVADRGRRGAAGLGSCTFHIHSTAIYRHAKARGLYVGWPATVRPPAEALLAFEMETLPLMERDLQSITGHLGQQGLRVTYELRMSGYASATANTVALAPTVWILYQAYSSVGAQVAVAELRQAVAGLAYLQNGLEIQQGGGRIELSSDKRLVKVKLDDKESIVLSDGAKLSVHMEDCQDSPSVCGALCCVTTEKNGRHVQSLCRIGGLLKVNGKYILGVSTSHAMLDGSGLFKDSFEDTARTKVPAAGQAVDRAEIRSESSRVSRGHRWHNVTRDAAVDFLGISMNSRGEIAINRSQPDNATNFALLRLGGLPAHVQNQYLPPGADEAVKISSTAPASAAAMGEGPVHIICGGSEVADGQLIWGSVCFSLRGRCFRVRRIQTTRPLSAGITGAWVVRGEVLYGVIIAVYDKEPFALMMTIERLFASVLGSAFSIRTVELWDGEVPEALKTHEANANSTKKAVEAKSEPRAYIETDDNPHGEGSSKSGQANDYSASPRPKPPPEGSQPLSPRPHTVDDAPTTKGHFPPSREESEETGVPSRLIRDCAATKATEAASPRQRRRSVMSHAPDMEMSGALPGHPDQASDPADRAGAPAKPTHAKAPEALERQDSGLDVETPPSRARDTAADLGAAADTLTAAGPRRNSLQAVLAKPFRRASTQGRGRHPTAQEGDVETPSTRLSGRRALFSRSGRS